MTFWNKVAGYLALLSVPIALIVSRHFNSSGWWVTLLVLILVYLQIVGVSNLTALTRIEFEAAEIAVANLLIEQNELVRIVKDSERTPEEQNKALQRLGRICFALGFAQARLQQQRRTYEQLSSPNRTSPVQDHVDV